MCLLTGLVWQLIDFFFIGFPFWMILICLTGMGYGLWLRSFLGWGWSCLFGCLAYCLLLLFCLCHAFTGSLISWTCGLASIVCFLFLLCFILLPLQKQKQQKKQVLKRKFSFHFVCYTLYHSENTQVVIILCPIKTFGILPYTCNNQKHIRSSSVCNKHWSSILYFQFFIYLLLFHKKKFAKL